MVGCLPRNEYFMVGYVETRLPHVPSKMVIWKHMESYSIEDNLLPHPSIEPYFRGYTKNRQWLVLTHVSRFYSSHCWYFFLHTISIIFTSFQRCDDIQDLSSTRHYTPTIILWIYLNYVPLALPLYYHHYHITTNITTTTTSQSQSQQNHHYHTTTNLITKTTLQPRSNVQKLILSLCPLKDSGTIYIGIMTLLQLKTYSRHAPSPKVVIPRRINYLQNKMACTSHWEI